MRATPFERGVRPRAHVRTVFASVSQANGDVAAAGLGAALYL